MLPLQLHGVITAIYLHYANYNKYSQMLFLQHYMNPICIIYIETELRLSWY